jgi:hypothetical protein
MYNRDNHTFNGTFIINNSNNHGMKKIKHENLHRSMICFNF